MKVNEPGGLFSGTSAGQCPEAAAKVGELTGIQRRPKRVRVFMKRLGLKRYKVGTIPAKADVEAQDRFKQAELEPHLEEARAGKRVIFYRCGAFRISSVSWVCLVMGRGFH